MRQRKRKNRKSWRHIFCGRNVKTYRFFPGMGAKIKSYVTKSHLTEFPNKLPFQWCILSTLNCIGNNYWGPGGGGRVTVGGLEIELLLRVFYRKCFQHIRFVFALFLKNDGCDHHICAPWNVIHFVIFNVSLYHFPLNHIITSFTFPEVISLWMEPEEKIYAHTAHSL